MTQRLQTFLGPLQDEERYRRSLPCGPFPGPPPAAPLQLIPGGSAFMWPDEFPLPPQAFSRQDESDDADFYQETRLVHHFGDAPREVLTRHYSEILPRGPRCHVDLCSSWVSHLPTEYRPVDCVGLGMSAAELAENKQLTRYVVKNLNLDPTLPFADGSVDVFTNAMSVDYLCRPLEVFKEMRRCLCPGGIAIMSFSNRCFPSKVISVWLSTNDLQHCAIAASYFHYTGFEDVKAEQVYTGVQHDPLHIIFGRNPVQQKL